MTTLFAVLLLVVWIYLASCFEAESFQNLYVNRLRSLMFRPVAAVERVLPRGAPEWAAPLVLLAAVAAIAGLLPRLLGLPVAIEFGGRVAVASSGGGGPAVLMVVARFALILAQLSLLRLLLAWRLGPLSGSSPLEFLQTATWPIPRIQARGGRNPSGASLWLQGACTAALFAAGAALALAAGAHGTNTPGLALPLAVVAAIDTLLLLRSLLFFFCICSFFGMSASPWGGSPTSDLVNFLGIASREWLADFIRATIGREIVIGAMGFAPLVIFFVIGFIHPVLVSLVV